MTVQEDLFVLLHSMMKKMRKIADKELVPLDLSHSEMRMLMRMYFFHPDGCGQEELVSQLEIDRSNVGRALKKLENLQYIERVKDDNDRRAYRVFLTGKGWAVRDRLFAIRETMRKTLTLGMSEQELDLLNSLLKKADLSLNEENFRSLKEQKQDLV
jgi:DNA-binding MarR family transcriptional regulator